MTEAEKSENNFFPPVGEAEKGQKLLRFLQRRLQLPESLLHRWLRTGQIRLNGKRSKPFEPVQTGDIVRLPPFVRKLAMSEAMPELPGPEAGLPALAGAYENIWAFAKPAGLAVQGGTGLSSNLATLLANHYRGHAFIPAPAHRLDKDTSGLLLVGGSFSALQQLQAWFAAGKVHKEYLAWTHGLFPYREDFLATHYLEGRDNVTALPDPAPHRCLARCLMRPLLTTSSSTLMQIRLLTGCKRQIRAQLAALGSPIQGDARYGAAAGQRLRLHSFRMLLPNGAKFELLPPWQAPWNVPEAPPPIWLPGEEPNQAARED